MDFGIASDGEWAPVADEHAEDWKRVGAAIAARIRDLRLTQAEVEKRGGPSDKTMKGYIEGRPIRRADVARGLCNALEWTVDSIDRLLAGDEPVEVPPTFDPSNIDRVIGIRNEMEDALEDVVVELVDAASEHGFVAVRSSSSEPYDIVVTRSDGQRFGIEVKFLTSRKNERNRLQEALGQALYWRTRNPDIEPVVFVTRPPSDPAWPRAFDEAGVAIEHDYEKLVEDLELHVVGTGAVGAGVAEAAIRAGVSIVHLHDSDDFGVAAHGADADDQQVERAARPRPDPEPEP